MVSRRNFLAGSTAAAGAALAGCISDLDVSGSRSDDPNGSTVPDREDVGRTELAVKYRGGYIAYEGAEAAYRTGTLAYDTEDWQTAERDYSNGVESSRDAEDSFGEAATRAAELGEDSVLTWVEDAEAATARLESALESMLLARSAAVDGDPASADQHSAEARQSKTEADEITVRSSEDVAAALNADIPGTSLD